MNRKKRGNLVRSSAMALSLSALAAACGKDNRCDNVTGPGCQPAAACSGCNGLEQRFYFDRAALSDSSVNHGDPFNAIVSTEEPPAQSGEQGLVGSDSVDVLQLDPAGNVLQKWSLRNPHQDSTYTPAFSGVNANTCTTALNNMRFVLYVTPGGSTTRTVQTLNIPLSVNNPCVDNAPAGTLTSGSSATTGAPYTLTGNLTDDRGLIRARINWGDGTKVDTIPVSGTAAPLSAAHTYASAGARNITVNVDDNGGNTTPLVLPVTIADPTAALRIRAVDLYSGMTQAARTNAANTRYILSRDGSVVKDSTVASGDLTLTLPTGTYTVQTRHPDMIDDLGSMIMANGGFAGLNKTGNLVQIAHGAAGTDLTTYLFRRVVPDVSAGYGTDGYAAIKFWLNPAARGGVTNRWGNNFRFWADTTAWSASDLTRVNELHQALQQCEGAAVLNPVTVGAIEQMNRVPTSADGNYIFTIRRNPGGPTAVVGTAAGWGTPLSASNPGIGLAELTFGSIIGISVVADGLEPNIRGAGGQNPLMTPTVPTSLSTTGQYMCNAVNSVPAGTIF